MQHRRTFEDETVKRVDDEVQFVLLVDIRVAS